MVTPTNELYHFGVKGMRWGVRRYQNEDGSLTAAGKRREKQDTQTRKGLSPRAKRAIKIGAAVGVTALAAYGATKLAKSESGQKLVSQLLNKNGKTTLDIGKARTNDARMIRTPSKYQRERFINGYKKSDALWTLNPEGQERLDRQERRNAKAMKNLGYTDNDAWNMHVTRSAGFNRKVDRRMDMASRGIHTKRQLGDYNTLRKAEAMRNARPWENEDATYFLRKNEETLRRSRK